MTAYLRLLVLRTVRTSWALSALAVGVGLPLCFMLATRFQAARPAPGGAGPEAAETLAFVGVLVLLGTGLVVTNLTAFLVHEEKQRGSSTLLRVATVDGFSPVAAYLAHGALLAGALTATGLVAIAAGGLGFAVPAGAWPRALVYLPSIATVFGPLGLWLGYLLPRGMALISAQPVAIWLAARLSSDLTEGAAGGRVPGLLLAVVLLVHLLTLGVLPPIWRRTSGRLW